MDWLAAVKGKFLELFGDHELDKEADSLVQEFQKLCIDDVPSSHFLEWFSQFDEYNRKKSHGNKGILSLIIGPIFSFTTSHETS